MSEALNDIYEYYVTRNTADAEALKKEMSASSASQAVLNFSSTMFDNYTSGGYIDTVNVPPGGNTIVYSSSPYTVVPNGSYVANWVEGHYDPFLPAPVDTEALAEKIVTRYIPGNPLVICIDNDLTSEQVNEITGQLIRHNIEAVLIRGAKAGTGRPSPGHVVDEGKRIDILARLAETWERHPDLTFAELIRWWSGENMTDTDFAAATDVYAKKVYE